MAARTRHEPVNESAAAASRIEAEASNPADDRRTTLLFAVTYATASSTMGIVNKWALIHFPYTGLMTAIQFFFTGIVVLALHYTGVIEISPGYTGMRLSQLVKVLPVTCVFYLAIFSSVKILQYATVELFIAFRSAVPLLVCVASVLLGRQATPRLSTSGALVAIVAGAAGFAAASDAVAPQGLEWAAAYLAVITFEMVYAKQVRRGTKAPSVAPVKISCRRQPRQYAGHRHTVDSNPPTCVCLRVSGHPNTGTINV